MENQIMRRRETMGKQGKFSSLGGDKVWGRRREPREEKGKRREEMDKRIFSVREENGP